MGVGGGIRKKEKRKTGKRKHLMKRKRGKRGLGK